MIEFDAKKNEANKAKHGISLSRAADLKIEKIVSDPFPGERRHKAFGRIEGKMFCLVFTMRVGRLRAISLRRVHAKEYARHVPSQET